MAWAEDEDDATRGQELHCRCGVVCSRAVKAVMREADKLAARADKYEMAQISEQLLENATVRHFLLAFEEQETGRSCCKVLQQLVSRRWLCNTGGHSLVLAPSACSQSGSSGTGPGPVWMC
ncbi:unnamed protein product [Effrenium voratum]|nr:unnamed protein product [Effrenium voratum]